MKLMETSLRYMRKLDRSANLENWPSLYYPELYLLDGGYQGFFQKYPDFCDPRDYVSMFDRRFISDCKLHSNLLKSKPESLPRSSYPSDDPSPLYEHYDPLPKPSFPIHLDNDKSEDRRLIPLNHEQKKSSKRNILSSYYEDKSALSKTERNIFQKPESESAKLNSPRKILFDEIEPQSKKGNREDELNTFSSTVSGKEDFIRNQLLLPNSFTTHTENREENSKRKRTFLFMSLSSLPKFD